MFVKTYFLYNINNFYYAESQIKIKIIDDIIYQLELYLPLYKIC